MEVKLSRKQTEVGLIQKIGALAPFVRLQKFAEGLDGGAYHEERSRGIRSIRDWR